VVLHDYALYKSTFTLLYFISSTQEAIISISTSTAVTERPRAASYQSVLSFNSTIRRAQSFSISYFGFRCTNANNQLLFCSLRRTIEARCHRQDSLMRGASSRRSALYAVA